MACRVESYQDSPDNRVELASFLVACFAGSGPDESGWLARFAYWWDANPFAQDTQHRGWSLRAAGRLVGFLGLIPTRYAWEGEALPALIATSWAVAEEHRNAALPMLMQLQRLSKDHLLLDTTPSEEVQKLLARLGWTGEKWVRRSWLPIGLAADLTARVKGRPWPRLPAGKSVCTGLEQVKRLASPWQNSSRVEKWISLDSLKWYADSQSRTHLFAGVVDEEGTLTSFLWLSAERRRGIKIWFVLEAYSAADDESELTALIGAVARKKAGLPGSPASLLCLQSFDNDSRWGSLPTLFRDDAAVCHFHSLPPALSHAPKFTVMAEGDFGL